MTSVSRGPASRFRRGARSQNAATLAPEAIDREALERAVKDEMERRERAQQARVRVADLKARVQAQATEQKRFDGGPCVYCGVTYSAVRDECGEVAPRWYETSGGPCCAPCDVDRHPLGGSVPLTDERHRERVVRRLVGEDASRYWWGTHILEKTGFKWWHETPDASPGERFAYVDANRLRATLNGEAVHPGYSSGPPCPRCGCAYMWVNVPERVTVMTHDPVSGDELRRPLQVKAPAHTVCHGCFQFPDLEAVAERLVGIEGSRREWEHDPRTGRFFDGLSAAQRIGLTWYEDRDKPRDGCRDLTLTPFAYLDLEGLRRKAYELFPESDMWRSKAIWQRLRDEAGTK